MSHFTTVSVDIENGDLLAETLTELGYTYDREGMVRGYAGLTTKADFVIRQENGYDLGFQKQEKGYVLVADFWGARIDEKRFLAEVTRRYAYKALHQSAAAQGFTVEQEETLPDGSIRVVVGRWV